MPKQLLDGKVTVLFSEKGMKISVIDSKSCIEFLEIELDQEQTCQVLGRLAHTPCKMEVRNIENVGRTLEAQPLEFKIPKELTYRSSNAEVIAIAQNKCPKGWFVRDQFNSQGSFFKKGDQTWARTTIFRYV